MKSLQNLIPPLALMLTGFLHAQDVNLGDVHFNAESATTDATWYEPMAFNHANVLEGFGSNAGRTRTITFSPGGIVAGVQTINRHQVVSGPNESVEDIWLAFDSSDNLRVLKVVRGGAVVFQAATTTPPLFLPSLPTNGQTWTLADTTVTVEYVIASFSGGSMKVKTQTHDGKSESCTYAIGRGLVVIQCDESSGWRPKPDEAPPR